MSTETASWHDQFTGKDPAHSQIISQLLHNLRRPGGDRHRKARLFEEVQAKTRDLSEALVYQTGSGNILRVIASSPTDVGPVLRAIVESACELCDAVDAVVLLKDGDSQRILARITDRYRLIMRDGRSAGNGLPDERSSTGNQCTCTTCSPSKAMNFPTTGKDAPGTGTRTILSVPLLREGESIGAIVLRRTEVHPLVTSKSLCCRPSLIRP